MLLAVFGLVGVGVVGAVVDPDGDTAADSATTSGPAATTAVPATSTSTSLVPATTGLLVTHVVDGDTVDVSSGARVRLIGIDTPERGECGDDEATRRVEQLVAGATIALIPGAQDDADHYGRILRYVEADGVDVGRVLLEEGLAIARYDSRDGYGTHPREAEYRLADSGTPEVCGATSQGESEDPAAAPEVAVHFQNCAAARAAGAAPLLAGEPGYRRALDRDGDGVACE